MGLHSSFFVAITLALTLIVEAFHVGRNCQIKNLITCHAMDRNDAGGMFVSLEKPLGLVLEEVEEGEALGVKVTGILEDGSASKSDFKDHLIGLRLASVMGSAVNNLNFDEVMAAIIEAPSPVQLVFQSLSENTAEPLSPTFPVGASVAISVLDGGKETVINAKVGENLRKTLLENNVEVYKGLKQKLGNCGGAGQCTFCAVEFLESEGWNERSDYEATKLRKNPTSRLSCLNSIQGPATVRIS